MGQSIGSARIERPLEHIRIRASHKGSTWQCWDSNPWASNLWWLPPTEIHFVVDLISYPSIICTTYPGGYSRAQSMVRRIWCANWSYCTSAHVITHYGQFISPQQERKPMEHKGDGGDVRANSMHTDQGRDPNPQPRRSEAPVLTSKPTVPPN